MTHALPSFRVVTPKTVAEALEALREAPDAVPCAGGTDMIVQLRRGLAETGMLVDLTRIEELRVVETRGDRLTIGAGVTLAALARMPEITGGYPAVAQAALSVAGPTHREAATLGGNLCLDTRCVYYNQSHWWRKSNAFCLKYRGDTCHVAPKGNRCRAAFSGDVAPALMVHGAEIEIAGADGRRRMPLDRFYREDGADHLGLQPGEIVTAVLLPPSSGRSGYEKVRLRGAIDFPLAGVAVARDGAGANGAIRFRVAVTGTNSCPVVVDLPEAQTGDAEAFFADLEKRVQKAVSPQRTTTVAPHYRRLAVSALAARLARRLS